MKTSMGISFFLCTLVLFASLTRAATSYRDEKVIRVDVDSGNRQKVRQLVEDIDADVWTHSSTGPMEMRVSSSALRLFQENDVPFKVVIDNLEKYVSSSYPARFRPASAGGNVEDVEVTAETFFKSYQNGEQIISFLDNLMSANKGIMKSQVIGKSVEGRNLKLYTVTGNASTTVQKKGFFVIGGQHAREWISAPTVTFMINEFVTKYGQLNNITNALDYFEFHFLPMMNPDGYAYTMNGARLWRKNRQLTSNSRCQGIDLNRNWPYQWDDQSNEGSSDDPCSEVFRGRKPMEAPEVASVVNYIQQNEKSEEGYWQGFIDFHAYSQLWMFPNAAQCESETPDHDILSQAAKHATDALFRTTANPTTGTGTKFMPGDACNIIGYRSTGSSMDWAYYVQEIMFSFAVELRDRGTHRFALPPDQIVPSGMETFAGLLGLSEYMIDFYKKGGKSNYL